MLILRRAECFSRQLLLALRLEFDFDIVLRWLGNCTCSSIDTPTQKVAEVDYRYGVESLVNNDCFCLVVNKPPICIVVINFSFDDCIFKTALNFCGVRKSDIVVFNAVDCKGYILFDIRVESNLSF